MARKQTVFERARDELFSHINRCGVLDASEDDQEQWMRETIEFVAERYPELNRGELDELHDLGIRFCRPAIPHGADSTAASEEDANVA